jgi:ankyrin repeat protein
LISVISVPALSRERNIDKKLFTAVAKKDYDQIRVLVKKGADVNAYPGNYYGNSFHLAIERANNERDLEIIKLFIKNGADVNSGGNDLATSFTPLMFACNGIRSNNCTVRFEIIKLLIKKRASINFKNPIGQSALTILIDTFPYKQYHALAHKEALRILEYMIKKRADVNQKPTSGAYPFNTALWKGSPELVEVLYKAGARIADKKASPLHRAVATGYYPKEKITVLMNHGLDINVRDGIGRTPFMRAVFNWPETALFLLEKGADIKNKDKNGDSALLILLKYSKEDMGSSNHGYLLNKVQTIRMLLDNGADVNAANRLGETPFSVVERMKYIVKRSRSLTGKYNYAIGEVEKMLLAKGAKKEKRDLFNVDDFKDTYRSWNFKRLGHYIKGSVKYHYTDEATNRDIRKTLSANDVLNKLRFFRGKNFEITSREDLDRGSEEVEIMLNDSCKGKRCPRFVSDVTLKLIIKDGKLLLREVVEYRSDARRYRGV